MKERIEYKLLSLTYKVLTTTQPTCLYKLISVVLLHPSSPLLDDPHLPHSKSQIAHFDMHHLVFKINFLLHSVNLILIILLRALLIPHVYSFVPSSLSASFTLTTSSDSKPTFSRNPSHSLHRPKSGFFSFSLSL